MAIILGFIGGLVAVGLKGYVDYLIEMRREERVARAAIRAIHDEFGSSALASARLNLRSRGWKATGDPSPVWREYRTLIAGFVDTEFWLKLSIAHYTARAIYLKNDIGLLGEDVVIGDDDLAEIQELCDALTEALAYLETRAENFPRPLLLSPRRLLGKARVWSPDRK